MLVLAVGLAAVEAALVEEGAMAPEAVEMEVGT